MEDLKQVLEPLLGPAQMIQNKLINFLPTLFSVIVVLLVGFFVASILQRGVVRFLKLAKLDTVSEKSGVANVLLKGDINQTLSEIIGAIVYWTMVLVVILAAVNMLELEQAASLLNSVILYIPNVLASVIIVVLGIFFSSILSTMVRTTAANSGMGHAKGLGKMTQIIVIVFTVIQALEQLKLDVSVLNMIVQATVYSLALGLALAIGLGCKDMAAQYVKSLIDSFKK